MREHRWTIPCQLSPDQAQDQLGPLLRPLERRGWTVFEQVDTMGFFGWTLRKIEEAVGVAVPQSGEPAELRVRASVEANGQLVIDALTDKGPLAGAPAEHAIHELAE